MTVSGFNWGILVTLADQQIQSKYSCLVLTIQCNLPFSFCKNHTVAKYTVTKPMTVGGSVLAPVDWPYFRDAGQFQSAFSNAYHPKY
ncbi:hypothetical protein PI125_g10509 [Phytophthora idaei]|nr:hypothetical protein PI125_g10509 [Phytophthora idaei]